MSYFITIKGPIKNQFADTIYIYMYYLYKVEVYHFKAKMLIKMCIILKMDDLLVEHTDNRGGVDSSFEANV